MISKIIHRLSISEKILFAFSIAAFIPIICLSYFSSFYVSNILEEEAQTNLIKQAKSHGLFIYEKINLMNQNLNAISLHAGSTLPLSFFSEFNDIELIKIKNIESVNFENINKTKLSYFNKNDNINLAFEKLHIDNNGNRYILRASLPINSLFSKDAINSYNDPICIISASKEILFCNNELSIKYAVLNNADKLFSSKDRILHHEIKNKEYALAAWELFLSSNFQSQSWYFVTLKRESYILGALKNFQKLLIPIALLFFISVSYGIYLFIKKQLFPLKLLTVATKNISQGQYDVDLDINTNDEFKDLGKSFESMSTTLMHQQKKDDIFSNIEQSILLTSDIHTAIKENISDVAELFDSNWLIITLINPVDSELSDSHSICFQKNNAEHNYVHVKHKSFQFEADSEDFHSIDNNEFHDRYQPLSAAFNSRIIWIKKLTLNDKVIGSIFIGSKNDSPLSSLNTAVLIEFSERFSTIYTTHKQRAELYYKANFDSLTKLSNRSHLIEKLTEIWPKAIKNKQYINILYIDLDNFKNVNDLSGHNAGNQILFQVAKRISQCVSEKSLLARLSGDEFCILCSSEDNRIGLNTIATNIINQLKEPFIIKDMSYFLGASIGIAMGPGNCSTPEALLEHADLAMYKAKQEGKNRYVLFNNDLEAERNYRLSLEHYLHFALQHNEINILFQPKIELSSGKMTSVECLARWHQRNLGNIPTEKFISLAEESGMINEIGTWILRKSCYQFVDWLNKDIVIESIAVNVSARQLASRDFSHIVASVLEETQIPPQCLDLEITESAFINDESFLSSELNKLHELGVKISIDDFGKEYSSLSYLKKIPFDTLKIDREFIIDLETDHRDQHIIDVIINIGHTLNKKIVAEGIETIMQREILKKYGCDIGQGFLFSKPLTDIEFLEFAVKYKNEGMITETLRALGS